MMCPISLLPDVSPKRIFAVHICIQKTLGLLYTTIGRLFRQDWVVRLSIEERNGHVTFVAFDMRVGV